MDNKRVATFRSVATTVLDMRTDNEGVATGCKKTCCNIKCCKGVSASEPEVDVRLLQQYIATGCKKISIATFNVATCKGVGILDAPLLQH